MWLLSVSQVSLAAVSQVVAVRVWPASSYTRVTVESNRQLKYKQFALSNPERVVVDIEDVNLNSVLKGMAAQNRADDPFIKPARVWQTVRMVFELKQNVKPQLFALAPVAGFKERLVMDLYPANAQDMQDPLLALLGTRSTDGALYAATRDYLQVLVAATPLFYLSNVFNYYLRNDGSQRRAGAGSVIGNLCDIALNITLVLALDMGTRGAALSTALGQIITIAIYLPGFFGQKHTLRFALPRGRWFVPALSALKAGMATSVQYLYQMIFFLVCNNLLIRLGGETAVAVFDVIQNTSYLILYLFEGTGRAMQPILSTYQGEHNRQGMRNTVRLGFTAGLTVGGALIALVELWPAGMCLLFGIAGSTSEALACTALRLYGAGALFAGINILLCNYYQACENEKPSFLLETLRGAVLLIPLTFVCYALGLQRFWLLFLLTEAGSLAVFLLLGLGGRYKKAELPEERIFQRTILSNAEDVMDVCRELEAFCEVWGADMKQQMFSTMTVEELGMAILKHGFQGRTDGYLQLTAIMDESGVLELHLRDDATTFNPFTLDTSRASWDEDFDMDGMGVLVIKKRAKEFFYRRYQGFNTLIIKI